MKSLYLLILLSFINSLQGMRSPSVRRKPVARASSAMKIAHQIVSQRTRMQVRQHDLLRTLSIIAPQKIKSEHIQPIVAALVHNNGIRFLAENKDFLESSISAFAKTPGFFTLLQRLFAHAPTDYPSFKGSMYELEQAMHIQTKSMHEKVTGLNQRVSCAEKIITKEFDICTSHGLIECKNIKWPSSVGCSHYLRAQFEQQDAIVKSLNASDEHKLYFEVRSKERIPNSWCQWFEDKGISYSF